MPNKINFIKLKTISFEWTREGADCVGFGNASGHIAAMCPCVPHFYSRILSTFIIGASPSNNHTLVRNGIRLQASSSNTLTEGEWIIEADQGYIMRSHVLVSSEGGMINNVPD